MKQNCTVSALFLPRKAVRLGSTIFILQATGVNIHFVSGHERDLDLIAAAGFKFVRMDFGWEGTEKAQRHHSYTWGL